MESILIFIIGAILGAAAMFGIIAYVFFIKFWNHS